MPLYSLWLLLCLLFIVISSGVVEAKASLHIYRKLRRIKTTSANQPYRTSYHFQPPKNWINDPNGPMIYKGIYHLFYQYNPFGAVWGNIAWGHSTSTDLINWTPHDLAFYPSQPYDIKGCWSGSATILPGGKPVMLYTGMDTENRQVQNLAMPENVSDPFLLEWIKAPQNPLMTPTPPNLINPSSFRDPTTAWLGPDGRWRVIVGNEREGRGIALLYRSKDFIHWIKAKRPLHSVEDTGMWECPDFYPVSISGSEGIDTSITGPRVKHVFKASLAGTAHDYYTIGSYSYEEDIYNPERGSMDKISGLRYDYGKFYASKTFFDDEKNRRVLWGWINESSSIANDISKGWSGVQAIPRTIWLDKTGKQLLQWPVVEIEQLRGDRVDSQNILLIGGSSFKISGVTAAQADVDISFEVLDLKKAEEMDANWTNPQVICSRKGASVQGGLGPFGLLVLASDNLEEYTAVFFRIFKREHKHVLLMCSDQSRSSLDEDNDKSSYGSFVDLDPAHEKLSLRSLIDHSIIESFGGEGKTCITARVYPRLAIYDRTNLHVFNNGTESIRISTLSAWSMKKAQINRSKADK